jgi:tetratricopeptide (TPR) repeat protein
VIVAAGLIAYHNSFSGPFVLDDYSSIPDNPSIRKLWPLSGPLSPPKGRGLTVEGRPVLNFSFALNYAFGGAKVGGYHAVNLVIHLLGGLTLFGLVRRTLLLPRLAPRFGPSALALAFTAALLWTVHPLQTQSVTYVVQRAESLMGLFFLLTFYFFLRGGEVENRPGWYAASFAACLLGMASKEVMSVAPVLVFLYDRTFLSGTVRAAWKQHRGVHLALASTWLLVFGLAWSTGGRGGTSGFGSGVSWPAYALTQFEAVPHYLRLAFWPSPLVFDYGTPWVQNPWRILPQILLLAALLAGTIVALRRWLAVGFLGAWFFAILAPTSLVPGNRQTLAEQRVYLPLAAVIVLVVVIAHLLAGRRAMWGFGLLAIGLGAVTIRRNEDYRSELALYRDTVEKRPENAFAQCNLGTTWVTLDRPAEAIPHYEAAIRLRPVYPEAENNLGNALLRLDRVSEAIGHFEEALRQRPDYAEAHAGLGSAWVRSGRWQEAAAQYAEALQLEPAHAEAHNNLANLLVQLNRPEEAVPHYEAALRLEPGYAAARNNFGNLLAQLGRGPEAITHYEEVLRSNPDSAETHFNLGNLLAQQGKEAEAITHFETALRLKPNYSAAHLNLGNALGRAGRLDEAIAHYHAALDLDPNQAIAHYALGNALLRQKQTAEAIQQFERALELRPDFPEARAVFQRLGVTPAISPLKN